MRSNQCILSNEKVPLFLLSRILANFNVFLRRLAFVLSIAQELILLLFVDGLLLRFPLPFVFVSNRDARMLGEAVVAEVRMKVVKRLSTL